VGSFGQETLDLLFRLRIGLTGPLQQRDAQGQEGDPRFGHVPGFRLGDGFGDGSL
jgi:hypothetical protein